MSSNRNSSRSRGRREADATASPVELPDVLQFMRLLWAIVHGLQRTSKRMAADLGVPGPQRLVLRVVGLHPGASAGALARTLHVHPSTLTGVLQRLVGQRLVRRSSDVEDRRRAVLHLTSRGERVNQSEAGTVETAITAALRGIGPCDAAAAERVLSRIADELARLTARAALSGRAAQTRSRRPARP